MIVKQIEVRDEGTCMPMIAIYVSGSDGPLMRRAGYGARGCVLLVNPLGGGGAEYDPYAWKSHARTVPTAHAWLTEYFDKVRHGQVVDVRVILGETTEPAVTDCPESPGVG